MEDYVLYHIKVLNPLNVPMLTDNYICITETNNIERQSDMNDWAGLVKECLWFPFVTRSSITILWAKTCFTSVKYNIRHTYSTMIAYTWFDTY